MVGHMPDINFREIILNGLFVLKLHAFEPVYRFFFESV